MKAQPKWSPLCGPTTLRNAAYLHGIRTTVQMCVDMCGTTHDGTTEEQIISGARKLGFVCQVLTTCSPEVAKQWALGPCQILCVDEWSHWVLVHGIVNDRYALVDPENSDANRAENHYRSLSWSGLSRKWRKGGIRDAREVNDCTFYGIALYRA